MKLIVGLGNPGPKYAGTRHNFGFDVVDILASRWDVSMGSEKFHGWLGTGTIFEKPVVLFKPTTYVNRSGQAVQAAGRFYKLDHADLLVICDDLALPTGRLRMRANGSAGSHNGLQDIIDRVGSDDWSRLRLGIGPALGDAANFVLGRFCENERTLVQKARERAADAVECWMIEGVEATMTRFNAAETAEP